MTDDGDVPTRARVLAALHDVVAEIDELAPGPHARGLAAQAETYRRVILRWETHAPTTAQLRALFELVAALRAELHTLSMQHTIPTRPPPGSDE